ncbi:hypothetical protein HPB49_021182 [Dermacentor silvarum]|uniref:Uncharacterized protein n=1 Tax=Dermacentor silvarum TaxID=543639 RepID=A0ACB8DFS8_DERSI|nr:hypothetical protein HPB49_021182 [Dermacentor silvarum]
MNFSVSPETLTVLQNFHERVKNRLLRLREQEEWRRYCVQHNISEKPQCKQRARSATVGPSVAPRRTAAHTTPQRVPIRKVSTSSPAYCLRSLSDQLAVYYRELERLQSDSYSCVVSLKCPEKQTSRVDDIPTVCAQTQTVSAVATPERVSEACHSAELNVARDKFRVMLNPDPNDRFSVVRKERVFRPLDGSRRRRVTWAGPVVESEKESCRASFNAHTNKHDAEVICAKSTRSLHVPASLIAELESYKEQLEGQATWKSLLEHDTSRNPWTVIDSITNGILGDVLNDVLEEVERVFSGIIDELLDQEMVEQVSF